MQGIPSSIAQNALSLSADETNLVIKSVNWLPKPHIKTCLLQIVTFPCNLWYESSTLNNVSKCLPFYNVDGQKDMPYGFWSSSSSSIDERKICDFFKSGGSWNKYGYILW